MNPRRIRILIVDDHPVVRKGTRALLDEYADMCVVGEASNGEEAVQLFGELKPDVVLMDLIMPKMSGIEATRLITNRYPHARILVLTSYLGDENLFPAIKAGARGYVLKDVDPTDLIESIRKVDLGEVSLSPLIAQRILNDMGDFSDPNPTPEPLSEREIEVLQRVARGMSNNEISRELYIAEVTVRTHISRLLEKLHFANRVQATLYALREGISTLDKRNS